MRRVLWPLFAVTVVVGSLVSLWQLTRVSHLVLVSFGDTALLLSLIADLFPSFAAIALGTAGLFGTVVAYDRLSEDGELTAMSASAVGPWRIFRPALVGGVVLSLLVLAASVWGEPWGTGRYREDVALLATRAFARTLKPGSFKNVGNLASVYVGPATERPDGTTRWEQAVVGRDTPRGPLVLTAHNVYLQPAGPGVLALTTGAGEALVPADRDSAVHRVTFESMQVNVDVAGWVRQETMTPYEFQEWDLATLWVAAHTEDPPPPNLGKLRFHLWQKLCVPWGMLVLCMLGALFGGQRAAAARGRAYLLSALVVAAYFGLLGLGRNLTIQGVVHGSVGANLGNLLGGAVLLYLWRARASRWA